MTAEQGKGNKVVHLGDAGSQEALRTYKRRRLPEPEPEPEPKPKPEPDPQPEHPLVQEQISYTFWRSRDIGWKHGIMIDENRQHWRCMYCGLTRYGGGVSRLKRHLAGDLDVKRCPRVPNHVSERIRDHLQMKRERRKKLSVRAGAHGVKIRTSSDIGAEKDPLPVDSEKPAEAATQVVEEVTNQANTNHQESTDVRGGDHHVKIMSSSHDIMAEKDPLPVDSEKLAEAATQVLEDVTNQANTNHQESTDVHGGDHRVKSRSSSHDIMAEKDPLPVDSEKPAEAATQVLEEVTNQANTNHQESTVLEGPILLSRARDIGWEHAVNVDGNKRRWKCKWCGLSRSGGVTTLKTHLTDNSCPNIPKDVSKKILNFIREKRATHHYCNSTTCSFSDVKLDKDQALDFQIQGGSTIKDSVEGTVQCGNDHQPSSNAMQEQTLKKGATIEGAAGSNQCSAKNSGQPLVHCEHSKKSGKQPEENQQMESNSLSLGVAVHHEAQNGHQGAEKINKRRTLETSKNPLEARFNTRKHLIMVDEKTRHWRCRYCSLDGYGKRYRLQYHLSGTSRHPRCPNVPKEISEEARNHIVMRIKLKRKRTEEHKPTNSTKTMSYDGSKLCRDAVFANSEAHAGNSQVLGVTSGQLKINNQLSSNTPQVPIKNAFSEAFSNFPTRHRDSAWEHSLVHDREKGHWQCKWCGVEGYHGVTRLKWHLVGWHNRRQCTGIPEDAAKRIRDQMMSREEQKGKRSGLLDSTNSGDVLCSSKSVPFDQEDTHLAIKILEGGSAQASKQLKICNPSSNTQSQKSANPQPIMEERHGIGLCENTNKPDENTGRNDCWSHWTSVLNGLLHLPGPHEGAGIQSCIRDVLLYGRAEVGTMSGMANNHNNSGKSQVNHEVKMDSDRRGPTNVNTAKCQNVLMGVLRSENFALLCHVLCRAVHQDENRSRYFDFSIIDRKMKSGDYEHSPELFNQDMQLIWNDLKMAGQDIVDLANSLSDLTEASYAKQAEGDKVSGDDEQKIDETVAASAEPKNMIQSTAIIASTSWGFNSLASDQMQASDVQKGLICNQCGKQARDGIILACQRCPAVCHLSCVRPPTQSSSTGRWYCKSCTVTSKKSAEGAIVLACDQLSRLHGNCAPCNRLEHKATVSEGAPVDGAPVDASRLLQISGLKHSKVPRVCKFCGTPEEDDKRFLICGHYHCPYKYYHIRCLKSKQIASMAQRNKPCWYCPSCLCRVCFSDKDDDKTILCDGCDEAYHLYCTSPPLTSVPKGRWYCVSCSIERAKEGMRQYERKMLKEHRNDGAILQRWTHGAVDLLLSAAEKLRAEEEMATSQGNRELEAP